jgi:hypothetical protein
MDSHTLLAKFRTHVAFAPEMRGRGQFDSERIAWLAKASALVAIWQPSQAVWFNSACDYLAGGLNRETNYATVMGTMHRAIATLEESLPSDRDQAFGPGAVYDFFVALKSIITSATKAVFLIDPYADDKVLDAYLPSVQSGVSVRILCGRYSTNVSAAAAKYTAQYSTPIGVRRTSSVHDRVVFVDNAECWVMGASINHAASKPTYLAPLSPDVSTAKLAYYEQIWEAASAI